MDPKDLELGPWELVHCDPLDSPQAVWRDAAGDVVSLGSSDSPLPSFSDVAELRDYCRRRAEERDGGLIEAAAPRADGSSVAFIYKLPHESGFKFFGIAAISGGAATWVWTIVAYERGLTGAREAVVTAQLIESGALNLDTYESSWAQDPYDPSYRGVAQETLRFISDAEEYDDDFPWHPLSKVRRELDRVLAIDLT